MEPTKEMLVKGRVALKQLDDAGTGLARIAILSAVDHDGDTYAPGAFGEQWAKVMPAHDWRSVPLGKARVFEQGDEALAEFRLNLDTAAGREWHAALKFDLEHDTPLQEWSYGFNVIDSVRETRDGETIRVLRKLAVHEISPVVQGAGVGTATLGIKAASRPFAQQLDEALAELDDVVTRAEDLARLREGDGRALRPDRIAALAALKSRADDLAATVVRLDALARPESQKARTEAGRLRARFDATLSRRNL